MNVCLGARVVRTDAVDDGGADSQFLKRHSHPGQSVDVSACRP